MERPKWRAKVKGEKCKNGEVEGTNWREPKRREPKEDEETGAECRGPSEERTEVDGGGPKRRNEVE